MYDVGCRYYILHITMSHVIYISNYLCYDCSVDDSDYMRNGDFIPTRMAAMQDAVNIVCHTKTRSNPENNVGLLTLAR